MAFAPLCVCLLPFLWIYVCPSLCLPVSAADGNSRSCARAVHFSGMLLALFRGGGTHAIALSSLPSVVERLLGNLEVEGSGILFV